MYCTRCVETANLLMLLHVSAHMTSVLFFNNFTLWASIGVTHSYPSHVVHTKSLKISQVTCTNNISLYSVSSTSEWTVLLCIRESFLREFGAWRFLAWQKRAIRESFLHENRIFTNLQKFSPSKVSCYTVSQNKVWLNTMKDFVSQGRQGAGNETHLRKEMWSNQL